MRKPINKWAIGIWILAAAILVRGVIDLVQNNGGMSPLDLLYFLNRVHAYDVAELVGLGVLIELADQIRRHLQSPK